MPPFRYGLSHAAFEFFTTIWIIATSNMLPVRGYVGEKMVAWLPSSWACDTAHLETDGARSLAEWVRHAATIATSAPSAPSLPLTSEKRPENDEKLPWGDSGNGVDAGQTLRRLKLICSKDTRGRPIQARIEDEDAAATGGNHPLLHCPRARTTTGTPVIMGGFGGSATTPLYIAMLRTKIVAGCSRSLRGSQDSTLFNKVFNLLPKSNLVYNSSIVPLWRRTSSLAWTPADINPNLRMALQSAGCEGMAALRACSAVEARQAMKLQSRKGLPALGTPQTYGAKNPFLFWAFAAISSAVGKKNVRLFHVIRDGRDCARSHHTRVLYWMKRSLLSESQSGLDTAAYSVGGWPMRDCPSNWTKHQCHVYVWSIATERCHRWASAKLPSSHYILVRIEDLVLDDAVAFRTAKRVVEWLDPAAAALQQNEIKQFLEVFGSGQGSYGSCGVSKRPSSNVSNIAYLQGLDIVAGETLRRFGYTSRGPGHCSIDFFSGGDGWQGDGFASAQPFQVWQDGVAIRLAAEQHAQEEQHPTMRVVEEEPKLPPSREKLHLLTVQQGGLLAVFLMLLWYLIRAAGRRRNKRRRRGRENRPPRSTSGSALASL